MKDSTGIPGTSWRPSSRASSLSGLQELASAVLRAMPSKPGQQASAGSAAQAFGEASGASRDQAHVFIAFLAYCLHVTLARRLHALAPGLTPRSVLEKFAAVQMIDVHLPTTDGRELVLTRYTEPEPELSLLLKKLKLELPAQPPPKITASAPAPLTPL